MSRGSEEKYQQNFYRFIPQFIIETFVFKFVQVTSRVYFLLRNNSSIRAAKINRPGYDKPHPASRPLIGRF